MQKEYANTPMSESPPQDEGPAEPVSDAAAQAFLQHGLDLYAVLSAEGGFEWVNRRWASLGWSQTDLGGLSVLGLVSDEHEGTLIRALERLARGEPVSGLETRFQRKDGSYAWLDWNMLRGADHAVYCTARDITERKNAEDDARAQARLLNLTQEMANVGHWRARWGEKTIFVSDEVQQMLGLGDRDALSEDDLRELFSPDACEQALDVWRNAQSGDGSFQFEVTRTASEASRQHLLVKGDVERGADEKIVELFGVVRDITESRALEERLASHAQELAHLANYDPLTGLGNRILLSQRLQVALSRVARSDHHGALMLIDLVDFKEINESYGQKVGDEVLCVVASRLAEAVRGFDSVARIGGDEFTVILDSLKAPEDATAVARRALDALHHPIAVDGREIVVSANVGVSAFPDKSTSPDDILRTATAALARAKEASGESIQFYDPGVPRKARRHQALIDDLHSALRNDDFCLYFQPRYEGDGRSLEGFEALIRWNRAGRVLSPGAFIGALEESNLIVPVGSWVLQSACQKVRTWQERFGLDLNLSVNVSPRQFSPEIIQTVGFALEESGLDASHLELELTERLLMDDSMSAGTILGSLKHMGLRISIDDFGTGYSALAYLKRFPVDIIKIDRAFVRDIPHADDGSIASAVILMAHSLGLEAVAEGIETEAQLGYLRSKGCDGFQGFFFGHPEPEEHIDALLERAALQCEADLTIDCPVPAILEQSEGTQS